MAVQASKVKWWWQVWVHSSLVTKAQHKWLKLEIILKWFHINNNPFKQGYLSYLKKKRGLRSVSEMLKGRLNLFQIFINKSNWNYRWNINFIKKSKIKKRRIGREYRCTGVSLRFILTIINLRFLIKIKNRGLKLKSNSKKSKKLSSRARWKMFLIKNNKLKKSTNWKRKLN